MNDHEKWLTLGDTIRHSALPKSMETLYTTVERIASAYPDNLRELQALIPPLSATVKELYPATNNESISQILQAQPTLCSVTGINTASGIKNHIDSLGSINQVGDTLRAAELALSSRATSAAADLMHINSPASPFIESLALGSTISDSLKTVVGFDAIVANSLKTALSLEATAPRISSIAAGIDPPGLGNFNTIAGLSTVVTAKSALDEAYNQLIAPTLSNTLDRLTISDIERYLEEVERHSDGQSEDETHSSTAELAEEIKQFQAGRPFEALTPAAKGILLWVFVTIASAVLVQVTNNFMKQHDILQLRVESVPKEARALKKVARNCKSISPALTNCRVIYGNNLRLRTGPSLKSEIIEELPAGKIVEVIPPPQDITASKSWLFVAIEIGGEDIRGWVSRRYTTHLK